MKSLILTMAFEVLQIFLVEMSTDSCNVAWSCIKMVDVGHDVM